MPNMVSANNYLVVLRAIKRRHYLLRDLIGERNGQWTDDTLEVAYLHVRTMLELIAFASLAANVHLYAQAHDEYASHWRAKIMLKELERINPDFYPKPMVMNPSKLDGVRGRLTDADSKTYLTKSRFESLWDKCGKLLHARNPFAPELDHQSYADELNKRHAQIIALLNHHFILLVDDPHMYYFELGADSEEPSLVIVYTEDCYTVFSPAATKPNAA